MSTTERPTVLLEHVILEPPDDSLIERARAVRTGKLLGPQLPYYSTQVAPGAIRGNVSASTYNGYRRGLTSACADIVLVGERDGEAAVALIKRAQPPFGDCWWIMGGAVPNYRPIPQFLLWKAHIECGLTGLSLAEFITEQGLADDAYACGTIHIVGCLGIYRTAAEDLVDPERVCDTLNLCFMGIVRGDQEIRYDTDHTNARWAHQHDLCPCGCWYPEHVAQRALRIYENAH